MFRSLVFRRRITKMTTDLSYTKPRQSELIQNYESILSTIKSTPTTFDHTVHLVAVSKLKPASDIQALYDHGVRHFGENYVQELIGKAAILPKDIQWHFIGGLQSNKCKDLTTNIENLFSVETIDSLKKAKKLNDSRSGKGPRINVFLQINASEEEQKSGLSPKINDELDVLVKYIISDASNLEFKGLMTIGSFDNSHDDSDVNPDFDKLYSLKKELDSKYNLSLELSMGMSADFEKAIKQGTSYVRIGTDIFGSRPPKN